MSTSDDIIDCIDNSDRVKFFEDNSHSHEYDLDEHGCGYSKMLEGINHFHEVVCFEVLPATSDGHIHSMVLPDGWIK